MDPETYQHLFLTKLRRLFTLGRSEDLPVRDLFLRSKTKIAVHLEQIQESY